MRCFILIRHKVRDYSNWRFEFDSLIAWRQAMGEKKVQVFRDEVDSNMITLFLEWDSVESATQFLSDPQLSELMQVSGVMDQPLVQILLKD